MEEQLRRIADALEGIQQALTVDKNHDDQVNFYELVRQSCNAVCNIDETLNENILQAVKIER
jgi:hypothetical protein